MILTIPKYIEDTGIQGAPIKHRWSEEASDDVYARESPKMEDLMDEISFRGVLALSAGISEWIAWRLHGLSNYEEPLQFIEAVWAGVIDHRYTIEWEWAENRKYTGPIDGPLAHSNGLLNSIYRYFCIRENGITMEAVYLIFLARHVMPKKKVFEDWLKTMLSRLTELYPREEYENEEEEELRPPVFREVLDPVFDFKPNIATELLSDFLKRLDRSDNPYLRSPEKMQALGFEGTPYEL